MSDTLYWIEVSIISTLLNQDLLTESELSYISSVELDMHLFNNLFHKNIIRAIKYLKSNNMPIFEIAITEQLQKRGLFDQNGWIRIMEANPLGVSLFKMYYSSLSRNKLHLHNMI